MNGKVAAERVRRRYPRASLRRGLYASIDGDRFAIAALDLGFGGARIEAHPKLTAGLVFCLQLDHDRVVGNTLARVAWAGGGLCGLQFVDPEDDFIDALVELLTPHLEPTAWDDAG